MAIVLPMHGGCLCGSLRYEIGGQPLMATICHCTNCQRRTGSAYSMNLIVRKPDFRLAHGRSLARELPTATGRINIQHFCEACLVRTHTEPVAIPDLVYVRPGTLDDPMQISPIAQIWTDSARPGALVAGVRAFEQNMDPAKAPDLIRAWRAAHPVTTPA
jgi:hypothetical protein